ncbi:unnamed protein product [Litomosoides sigmodontis]|uniref:Uncharacterized protein n=1 Tax=Litomosoides sigmodontis TaxID=42156 RepID=A0A3P6SLY0_LITSI|nr:unnamed protein product [Litomosoides sigmodontis]
MSPRFIFHIRINIPTQMLRQEECRVPFIVAHGPRSIEFEFKIDVTNFHRQNPTLLVNCQSELRVQIFGLIAIRFGASKGAENTIAAQTIMNETEEMNFGDTFTMRGSTDPFLKTLHNTITLSEYANGLIGFSILMTYEEAEFMQFVEQKSRLRPLMDAEMRNCLLNIKAHRDFIIYDLNGYSIMCSKWMLYMSTKYFHKLIDRNATLNQATLNYPHDVIIQAVSLALQNQFQHEYQDVRKMCQIIELLCILEPVNVDIAIETVATKLECRIFDEWKYTDLDDLVRILTLPKYWEMEELKVAARSVIINLHSKQFQEEYNEQSTGERCAIYQELISSGTLDEVSKPVESELAKIKRMRWKMSKVRKTVEFFEESLSK